MAEGCLWHPACPLKVQMLNHAQIDSPQTLYEADGHALLRIRLITGDWGVRRSFNQMGIHAGDDVRILSRAPFGGPLVIENRGTKVAIGKQLAEQVRVEVIP
jgi:Fe2+ transport system protein FeoA